MYDTVVDINGTAYDAIVTIDSISNALITNFDNSTATNGNDASYFSPQVIWTGAGSIAYSIAFIEDGTAGAPVTVHLDDLYFRIEHERTLTVDKDTAAFFIDVEVMPLSTVFHLKTEYRNLIKDSINSMSENVLAYKNLEEVKEMINGTT